MEKLARDKRGSENCRFMRLSNGKVYDDVDFARFTPASLSIDLDDQH